MNKYRNHQNEYRTHFRTFAVHRCEYTIGQSPAHNTMQLISICMVASFSGPNEVGQPTTRRFKAFDSSTQFVYFQGGNNGELWNFNFAVLVKKELKTQANSSLTWYILILMKKIN